MGDLKAAENTQREFISEDNIPLPRAMDSIPVLSQVKSAVQAMRGDMAEATQTQENFSQRCIVISQLRSAVEASMGDLKAAENTQREFIALENVILQGSMTAGLIAGPLIATAAIEAAGFTSAGIAAGSWGAGFMSSYGGAVPAGSLCATLQSAGAVGLSAGASALASGAVGAAAASTAGAIEEMCFRGEEGKATTRVELERYIAGLRDLLKTRGDDLGFLIIADRNFLERKICETLEWLSANPHAEGKECVERLRNLQKYIRIPAELP